MFSVKTRKSEQQRARANKPWTLEKKSAQSKSLSQMVTDCCRQASIGELSGCLEPSGCLELIYPPAPAEGALRLRRQDLFLCSTFTPVSYVLHGPVLCLVSKILLSGCCIGTPKPPYHPQLLLGAGSYESPNSMIIHIKPCTSGSASKSLCNLSCISRKLSFGKTMILCTLNAHSRDAWGVARSLQSRFNPLFGSHDSSFCNRLATCITLSLRSGTA